MNYLLDSNAFIQAKNTYYSMAICPGFWDWILHSNNRQGVSSIDFVRKELEKGKDDLTKWVKNNPHIFVSVDDELTQKVFGQVANYVNSLSHLKDGAKSDFLSGADPWLIAKAIVTSTTIVTHEKLDLQSKRKVFIPNICQNFKVTYIDTFELLHVLKAQFVLRSEES